LKTLQKLGLAAVLATTMGTAMARDHGEYGYVFKAKLSPAQSDVGTTPVAGVIGSDATGSVVLKFAKDLSSATYTIKVANTNGLNNFHFHCAPAGLNGQPVAPLNDDGTSGITAAQLEQFRATGSLTATITNVDIDRTRPVPHANCNSTVVNIAALFKATREGEIYANVHTDTAGTGELRGQIFSKK